MASKNISYTINTYGITALTTAAINPASAQGFGSKVVSVHSSDSTEWDHVTDYYWNYVDQNIVNNMIAAGLRELTNASTVQNAWQSLISYQEGEDEDLYADLDKSVAISGGYDCYYTDIIGKSSLNGNIIMSNGQVTVEGFIIH